MNSKKKGKKYFENEEGENIDLYSNDLPSDLAEVLEKISELEIETYDENPEIEEENIRFIAHEAIDMLDEKYRDVLQSYGLLNSAGWRSLKSWIEDQLL